MASEDMRARLREQPAAVHYDVARGLARHQALVEAGAPAPDWAREASPRGGWLRRVAFWGGALTLVALLATRADVRSTPSITPTARVEPTTRANPPKVERERTSEERASESTDAPSMAPTQATASPPSERSLPTQERAHVRRRVHATKSASALEDDDGTSRTSRGASIVAPERNVELEQLVEAERALGSEPVRALRLVREGELSYRHGYFAQERHYVEVMALFALGRRGEAHARATAFLQDYPNAPYRRKVELEMARQPPR